ncbi:5-oxoprolinase subunit PxpA [Aeromicrobium sp. NPDC092404]|uniref:LamB/YcsF family protein n=1 Tax=Aeromicrobium sp. NPDC092404 TaxID=3154976 RepID=UPI00341535EF
MRIDLNADLGESWPRWESGEDLALLALVTSANVCCGAYAGDADLMRATCEAAVSRGTSIGAQVGYPDRDNFGRLHLEMPPDELTGELLSQILLLDEIARSVGGTVSYVKPHGALYNAIVDDDVQAQAVVDALQGLAAPLPLLGLPGSVSLSIAEASGIPIVREGFADRAYTSDGRLVPRGEPGAVIDDPVAVAAQAVRLMDSVSSVCVHSDSPGAVELARAVRVALEAAGAELMSVGP